MDIRLGIIGSGRIAARAVKEINTVDGIGITAAVNPNREHACEFADKYGIDNALEGIEDLKGVADAVYVASPHGTHYEYARRLLEMGLHVICEKPMAFKKAEAETLFDIAAEKGLVLMEGIKTAYCPGFKKIEEIISAGTIGNVIDVDVAFTRLTEGDCREYSDRKYGGAFTEFGTYTMLPILRFLGDGNFDVAFMSTDADGVDGYTRMIFDREDRFGSAKTGLNVKSEGQLVISGTGGYILAPSPWWLTRYFEVRYEDPGRIDRYECEFEGDGLRYEFAEFKRRIDESTAVPGYERTEAGERAWIYEKFLDGRIGG